jgi:hypothetical protein
MFHIDTVYRPNMGFWALILIVFATIAAIPVATVTFFAARVCIAKGFRPCVSAGAVIRAFSFVHHRVGPIKRISTPTD